MDIKNTIIANPQEEYVWDGGVWQFSVGTLLNIPFLPGFKYTLQSIDCSYMQIMMSGVIYTSTILSGTVPIFMLSQLEATYSQVMNYSVLPLCRYYKDIPYISAQSPELNGFFISSASTIGVSPLVYLDPAAFPVAPAPGDRLTVQFRFQVGYEPINFDELVRKPPQSNINTSVQYKRARGLNVRD